MCDEAEKTRKRVGKIRGAGPAMRGKGDTISGKWCSEFSAM